MSSPSPASPRLPGVGKTRVWLPVAFASVRADTGFSSLQVSQVEDIIRSLPSARSVSPEVLGARSDFAHNLERDIRAGSGDALDDFNLLLEALSYNLIRLHTYDLNDYQMHLTDADERFVTVFLFKAHERARQVCAGSFAPRTLVCPAAEWEDKSTLKAKVLGVRNTKAGLGARGLVSAFLNEFDPQHKTLWGQAVGAFLRATPGQDPGELHQRNIGAFFLQQTDLGDPIRVFFPQYEQDYLPTLSRKLCADHVLADSSGHELRFYCQNDVICALSQIQSDFPDLYGYGLELHDRAEALPPNLELNEGAAHYVVPFAIHYLPLLSGTNPRFRAPDCLRCFFTKFGRAAAVQILHTSSPHAYSKLVLELVRDKLPHEVFRDPGRHKDQQSDVLIEGGPDFFAYYVESFQGTPIRELSRIGFALWLLFRRDADWDPASHAALWNGQRILLWRDSKFYVDEHLRLTPPDHLRSPVDFLKFLFNAKNCHDELFQSSVECYLGGVAPAFADKAVSSDAEPFDMEGRTWYRLRRSS